MVLGVPIFKHFRVLKSSRSEGVFDDNFSYILIKTICCDPSSEPSHQDGADEGSQYMFFCRINKNYP